MRVVQLLDAGAVDADVVGGPADPEVVTAGGQLADQVGELAVVGVAAGFGAQQGDGVVGHDLPVAEQRRGARVEEHEAGVVHRLVGVVERVEQGPAELVGGEHVESAVEHDGRHGRHRVEQALDRRPDPIARRRAPLPGAGGRACGAEQVEQVRPFGVVEPQRMRDAVDDARPRRRSRRLARGGCSTAGRRRPGEPSPRGAAPAPGGGRRRTTEGPPAPG